MSLDFYLLDDTSTEYYWCNITHNLGRMAAHAGIYDCLWHPEDYNIFRASQIIEPLEKGLAAMKAFPEIYRKYDAPNKWGTYDDFVPWLEELLDNCRMYPDAQITASR